MTTQIRRIAALTLAAFWVAGPALPWNAVGHRVIASIAYDNLTPAARARVDDLIRRHPDYQSHFLRDAPADPALRAREAFMEASVWPDQVRNDLRFYDDTQPQAARTPLLAGFPEMGRHTNWHYTNIPFTQDGTRGPDSPRPNAVTELGRLIGVLGKRPGDRSNPVYALPWFLHLAGDLHNPLHAVARFSRELPGGDRGGNLVFVQNGQPLHAFWDDLLEAGTGPELVSEYRAKLSLAQLNPSPKSWAQEGFDFAMSEVYTFGSGSGSHEKPIALSSRYGENARRIAGQRAVQAGLRMASILNRELK